MSDTNGTSPEGFPKSNDPGLEELAERMPRLCVLVAPPACSACDCVSGAGTAGRRLRVSVVVLSLPSGIEMSN